MIPHGHVISFPLLMFEYIAAIGCDCAFIGWNSNCKMKNGYVDLKMSLEPLWAQ